MPTLCFLFVNLEILCENIFMITNCHVRCDSFLLIIKLVDAIFQSHNNYFILYSFQFIETTNFYLFI